MKYLKHFELSSHCFHGMWVAFLSLCLMHSVYAAPAQDPIIIGSSVKPIMMLNMSRDHQLFFKLYDDYGDITNSTGGEKDGVPDTTYIPKYEYYGYFDSKKCYKYDNADKRFEPNTAADADHYCTPNKEEWSGNFLNWATMTRVDAVRKILYGGMRSTDSASETVLERALLPHDAHSFAKFYDGADIAKLTPFTVPMLKTNTEATGITICNTTADNDAIESLSQKISSPPLLRVVKGNYSLWASNERWQCNFDSAPNSNVKEGSGIYAYSAAPALLSTDKLNVSGVTNGEYVARVQVCVAGALEDNCKQYPDINSAKKPTGLFQEFGENGKILFGLMSGSYSKNKSGGVLRKAVGDMTTEINIGTNGIFTKVDGAIKALDSLKIYGYNYSVGDGTYSGTLDGNDSCPGGISGFANGTCSNWGNPQSEIYLESLRYLAGANSALFYADDSARISGLKTIAWPGASSKVLNNNNYCAPLSILQFNASSSSFDDDELGGASDLGITNLNTWIDELGNSAHENLSGKYFVGQNSANKDGICTGKDFSDLSSVLGTCPDAPRLKGSYGISGLAYYARKNDINTSVTGKQIVQTYGVALAPAVPSIKIPVPGAVNKTIELLPACKSNRTTTTVDGVANRPATREGNCAIVDFKIVKSNISATNSTNTAKLYVNWESAEQGLDYDQDVWGTIDVEVTSSDVKVLSRVFATSTGASMGFGYVISGTEKDDGFKVHSGVRDFIETGTYCSAVDKCTCNATDSNPGQCIQVNAQGVLSGMGLTPQQTYKIATSNSTSTQAKFLKSPLELAAKWGGYSSRFEKNVLADGKNLESEINKQAKPETYFYATDPRMLEKSLQDAFNLVAATIGSSATVAANSTRLDGETYVYQALFNSDDWTGDISAFKVEANGTVNTSGTPKWKVSSRISRTGRSIYTYDGSTSRTLVKLSSTGIDSVPSLKAALKLSTESDYVHATNRFKWLLGEDPDSANASALRNRKNILGDIVNSDPAFAGPGNLRYRFLPTAYGSSSFQAYADKKREFQTSDPTKRVWRSLVLVGANDGMMHAFDADTGDEVFAYIPRGVYSKLAELSGLKYKHQYTVDGPITVGDVYFDSDNDGTGGEWRTIAVGTLGAGGRGAYALDITDVLKSTSGTPKIIFDVSAEDTTVPYRQNLGFSMSRPLIVPTRDSNWKIIFSNGPNSDNGTASLIAVDPENPTQYKVIDTQAKVSETSTDNGLFGVALLPDGDGVIEAAFGGDILGNMWKLDLSDTDYKKWKVAYANAPLVRVVDSNGVVQPITSTPTLGINELKMVKNTKNVDVPATMVYFGTGKYYEKLDPNDTQVQTVYGIADVGSMIFKTDADRKEKLNLKEVTAEFASGGLMKRTVTGDGGVASEEELKTFWKKNGWFIDLKLKSGTAKGERVISKPLLVYDRLIFSSFIPSTAACDYGGTGWLMELTGVGNKYATKSVLATAANTSLESPILGDLISLSAGENLYILGSGLGSKDLAPPIISKQGNNFGDKGRISWQQLK